MPDTDVDKPGKTPPSKAEAGDGTKPGGSDPPRAPLSLEEELDQLLADIEIAVDDLDPLGELEEAAAKAREDAKAGDPEYDETDDLFEVVTPSSADDAADEQDADEGNQEVAVDIAGVAEASEPTPTTNASDTSDAPPAIDAELDELIEKVAPKSSSQMPVSDAGTARPEARKQAQVSVEHSQIDHELDALLAEAGALMDEDEAECQEEAQTDAAHLDTAETVENVEPPPTMDPQDTPEAVAEEPIAAVEADPVIPESDQAQASEDDLEIETLEQVVGEPVAEESVSEDEISDLQPDPEPEPEPEPESQSESEPESVEETVAEEEVRSIEEIDADLAAKAEEVAAIDEADESEADDFEIEQVTGEDSAESDAATDETFQTSDDIVDAVIEEHASAVQEEQEESQPTDDLAELMVTSPASAELGIAENTQADSPSNQPEPAAGSAAPVNTPAPAPAATVTQTGTKTKAPARLLAAVWTRVSPLAEKIARVISKPLELMPPKVRDDIGWLALVTLFLAMVVMIALALFR